MTYYHKKISAEYSPIKKKEIEGPHGLQRITDTCWLGNGTVQHLYLGSGKAGKKEERYFVFSHLNKESCVSKEQKLNDREGNVIPLLTTQSKRRSAEAIIFREPRGKTKKEKQTRCKRGNAVFWKV